MKRHFLVGNFLPAYKDAYKYREGYGRQTEKADPQWLEDRFTDRTAARRRRASYYLLKMQLGTAAALLLAISATFVDFDAGASLDVTLAERETVALQEITQTVQHALPPPPPKPAVPVLVPDDELLTDDDLDLDLDATLDLTDALPALPPPPPVEQVEEVVNEHELFAIVEEQPEIIGGIAELADDVIYPPMAVEAGIEGMVIVKVIITADGRPDRPEVVKSPSEILESAAIDAVMKQRFKPGRQRGRPVAVEMAIPVWFQLTG